MREGQLSLRQQVPRRALGFTLHPTQLAPGASFRNSTAAECKMRNTYAPHAALSNSTSLTKDFNETHRNL